MSNAGNAPVSFSRNSSSIRWRRGHDHAPIPALTGGGLAASFPATVTGGLLRSHTRGPSPAGRPCHSTSRLAEHHVATVGSHPVTLHRDRRVRAIGDRRKPIGDRSVPPPPRRCRSMTAPYGPYTAPVTVTFAADGQNGGLGPYTYRVDARTGSCPREPPTSVFETPPPCKITSRSESPTQHRRHGDRQFAAQCVWRVAVTVRHATTTDNPPAPTTTLPPPTTTLPPRDDPPAPTTT